MTEYALVARAIVPVLRVAVPLFKRLYFERRAAKGSSIERSLMEEVLDATLERLTADDPDIGFWKRVLRRAGNRIVAVGHLEDERVRLWLAEEAVVKELLARAEEKIVAGATGPVGPEVLNSYVRHTGELRSSGEETVDLVVAILVSGFDSLDPDNTKIAALIQASNRRTEAKQNEILAAIGQLAEKPLPVEGPSSRALDEYKRLRRFMGFDGVAYRAGLEALAGRLRDGDLVSADPQSRAEILGAAARASAAKGDRVGAQRHLANMPPGLGATKRDGVEALLAGVNGDSDKALSILQSREDEEGRSLRFVIIAEAKGHEAAVRWAESGRDRVLLGLDGYGATNYALALFHSGMCREAADFLSDFPTDSSAWLWASYLEGLLNACLLLPEEARESALSNGDLLQTKLQPIQVADSELRREKARVCFDRVAPELIEASFKFQAHRANEASVWLGATSAGRTGREARAELRRRLAKPKPPLHLVRPALAVGLDFDAEALRQHVDSLAMVGGLEPHELEVELELNLLREPSDVVEYLAAHEERLATAINRGALRAYMIEGLARSQQEGAASELLEASSDLLPATTRSRLAELVGFQSDPSLKRLMRLFRETDGLPDLTNLVSFLVQKGDYSEARPLAEELFARQRNSQNALRAAFCMQHDVDGDDRELVEFLAENLDLLEENLSLKSLFAWAKFRLGNLKEGKALADELIAARAEDLDVDLALAIAVQLGDWESFPLIIASAEPFEGRSPKLLIRLARAAATAYKNSDRALQLAAVATTAAPADAEVQLAAYTLATQLGRENEWGDKLQNAIDASSQDGPLVALNHEELLELVRKKNERDVELSRMVSAGALPLHVATDLTTLTMSTLLITNAKHNLRTLDRRRASVIPVFSGARQPCYLRTEQTVALDTSAVIVLHQLGLLNRTIESFGSISLPPSLMEVLLAEQQQVLFHQPSLLESSSAVVRLFDEGLLSAAPTSDQVPSAWHSQDDLLRSPSLAGEELAIVSPLGVWESENRSDEEPTNHITTLEFLESLAEAGLGRSSVNRARTYLQLRDQDRGRRFPISQHGFVLHDLAISYLQKSGVLREVAAACRLFVLRDSVEERRGLLDAAQLGEETALALGEIRQTLKNAIASGGCVFSPLRRRSSQGQNVRTIEELALDPGSADVAVVDDRFVNAKTTFSYPNRPGIPIATTLDVVDCLAREGAIDWDSAWEARHMMRRAGFAFVPISRDELEYWGATLPGGVGENIPESAELASLRHSLARLRTVGLLEIPAEGAYLRDCLHEVVAAIRSSWEGGMSQDEAAAHSSFLLGLAFQLADDWGQPRTPEHSDNIPALYAALVHLILAPCFDVPEDLLEARRNWAEDEIIESLTPANRSVISALLDLLREGIREQPQLATEERTAYGALVISQLPQALAELISEDRAFLEAVGLPLPEEVLTAAGHSFNKERLFGAVVAALDRGEKVGLPSSDGSRAEIEIAGSSPWLHILGSSKAKVGCFSPGIPSVLRGWVGRACGRFGRVRIVGSVESVEAHGVPSTLGLKEIQKRRRSPCAPPPYCESA